MKIHVTKGPLTTDLKEHIYKEFAKHAVSTIGFDGLKEDPISFEIRENEALIGTCVVQIFWGQLHIKYLLIEEAYRLQGYAKKLIEYAFEYGKKRGCHFAFVETMSFQAPEFYQKLGFKTELERDGYAGSTRFYYLKKDLLKYDITIRKYQPSDTKAIAHIYYHTIHNINIRDYTEDQVNAWAPLDAVDDCTGWEKKLTKTKPFVAVIDGTIAGFAELEPNGHIDCFYVHHKFQGKGIGTKLIEGIEKEAIENNIHRIYAEVSITAKPFFERMGFNTIKQQTVVIRGCELMNFIMEKTSRKQPLHLRHLELSDISAIIDAFAKVNWPKHASTFKTYYQEQVQAERVIWIAYIDDQFAGYVTLKWQSQYKPFANAQIPEIMDLNVLPPFRKAGVGSKLLEHAEKKAATKSTVVGLGVGLYGGPDGGYGAAHRLYIQRGYIPNGKGVTYNYQHVTPGDSFPVDDDLLLWLTKNVQQ